MSFNPIDIIRTQEASQLRHIENQKIQYAQNQVSKNYQNNIKQEQLKPSGLDKTENSEYRYDAKEKGNNQYYNDNRKRKEAKPDEAKKPKDSKRSGDGSLDVRI